MGLALGMLLGATGLQWGNSVEASERKLPMKITQAVPAMFAALAALTMKTIMTSHSRPLAGLSGLFTPNRKPAKSEMSVELGMISRLLDRMASLLRVLSAGALLGCASAAVANPITVPRGVSLRRLDTYVGSSDTEQIIISADSVIPNGTTTGGTTATAQETALPSPSPTPLPFDPSTVLPNQFVLLIPYDSELTNPWTLTFTNDVGVPQGALPDTYIVTTPSLVDVAPALAPINATISGTGLNPTFTWFYPTSVDGVTVEIYEEGIHIDPTTGKVMLGGSDNVFGYSLPGATGSYPLGYTLTPGTNYQVVLRGAILRDLTLPLAVTNANIEAESHVYYNFTATSAPIQAPIYLPTIDSNGVYHFNMAVQQGTTYDIDPNVATGFVYATGAGNPNFATVVLPTLQPSEPYTITWDNGLHKEQRLGGEILYFLQTDPSRVSTFTVRGIDPADGLDPRSGTEFVTGLTFAGNGSFTGTMTPLATIYIINEGSHTVSVIDPSTNTVVDTVRVGFGPVQAVLAPKGTTAYVLNSGAGTVSVV